VFLLSCQGNTTPPKLQEGKATLLLPVEQQLRMLKMEPGTGGWFTPVILVSWKIERLPGQKVN
jgi:hypothetical protein